MQNWQTLERREVLRTGDGTFLSVEYHTVRLPDGRLLNDWPWIRTPDYVNMLAQTTDGHYLCFRQTKYAVDGLTLAVPGGYIEPGEDPLVAAQRELLEETGYAADQWIALGSYAVDGNRGCGKAHLFLALGADYAQPVNADDLEEQELLKLTRAELAAALAAGEFKLLPWAALVALALAR